MKYNPKKHNRQSIRLKGYDYSKAGLYFITINCQNRAHLFGHIQDQQMILNQAGQMAQKWYHALESKYPDVRCHELAIMPDHLHCILQLTSPPARADQRVCPNPKTNIPTIIQWYKTMTTNAYIRGVKEQGWPPFQKRVWQRNYWDQIIWNEEAYHRIAQYIKDNPKNWHKKRKP